MKLKRSEFCEQSSYRDILLLANKGIGIDKSGYKKEFIRLVESVQQMDMISAK